MMQIACECLQLAISKYLIADWLIRGLLFSEAQQPR